jgi:hypothetical protein
MLQGNARSHCRQHSTRLAGLPVEVDGVLTKARWLNSAVFTHQFFHEANDLISAVMGNLADFTIG